MEGSQPLTLSLFLETGMVQAATLKHQDSVTVIGSTLRKPRRDEASGTTFVPMIPKGPWTVLHEISTISDSTSFANHRTPWTISQGREGYLEDCCPLTHCNPLAVAEVSFPPMSPFNKKKRKWSIPLATKPLLTFHPIPTHPLPSCPNCLC